MKIKSHVRAGAVVAQSVFNNNGINKNSTIYYPPVGRCVGL